MEEFRRSWRKERSSLNCSGENRDGLLSTCVVLLWFAFICRLARRNNLFYHCRSGFLSFDTNPDCSVELEEWCISQAEIEQINSKTPKMVGHPGWLYWGQPPKAGAFSGEVLLPFIFAHFATDLFGSIPFLTKKTTKALCWGNMWAQQKTPCSCAKAFTLHNSKCSGRTCFVVICFL